MRLYFVLCIALMSIILAIPFAPGRISLSVDTEFSNLISSADEAKPDLFLSEFPNDGNSDNNQLEGLLRRENRKAACPSGLDGTTHSINTQLGGTDPNQLDPEKPKNPCAEYGSYHIGTCGGPAYGLMTDGSFYSVFNCIKGKPVIFLQCGPVFKSLQAFDPLFLHEFRGKQPVWWKASVVCLIMMKA